MIRATPDGRVVAIADTPAPITEPYFVSGHAASRYVDRVDPRASMAHAMHRIEVGLQGQAPTYPVVRPCAIADAAMTFVAVVAPPTAVESRPQVVTIWKWGVSPYLLRRKRCVRGDKRYRYLAPGAMDTAMRQALGRARHEARGGR